MTQKWKPTPAEKRTIRAYAAKHARRKPGGIVLEIGERSNGHVISTNVLAFGSDWVEGVEHSDLHQPLPWSDLSYGVELIEGKGIVDFYVYEKRIGEQGELLTNVQACAELVDGTPRLVALAGTGSPFEAVSIAGAVA